MLILIVLFFNFYFLFFNFYFLVLWCVLACLLKFPLFSPLDLSFLILHPDYKPWPVSRRDLILPHSDMNYGGPYKFVDKSETATHFVRSDGKAADSAKPPQTALIATEPFDSLTSHQIEFPPKAIPDRFHRDKMVFQPPTVPHNMSSTYRGSYKVILF